MTSQAPAPRARCGEVREIRLQGPSQRPDEFARRRVEIHLRAPGGETRWLPAFYAGDGTWCARWTPDRPGTWHERIVSTPHHETLEHESEVEVSASDHRGMVRATPGRHGGFSFADGHPAPVIGDTVYNLFGMAYNGIDVDPLLRRRAEQGFTLLRVRLPVSPFHPETAVSRWQHRSCFPWGGSEQAPLFDRFRWDYFDVVDQVVRRCGELGLGLEMIMEAWGFDFPFNDRGRFTAEWEELWLRYLVARYDAFPQVWMWTPMNEYEQYPDGVMAPSLVADLWLQRTARLVKDLGCHGHVLACHNGPVEPPLAQRWSVDAPAIDAVMFQHWGTFDAEHGWLTEGIEEQVGESLAGFTGSSVLAEWGYERNPDLDLDVPWHEHMGIEHTRRGAWRAVFLGMGYVHGFENTWGPWALVDSDQPGMEDLVAVHRIAERYLPWTRMQPADPSDLGITHRPPDSVGAGPHGDGQGTVRRGLRARALTTPDRTRVALYLPAGGELDLPPAWSGRLTAWIDPRTGEVHDPAAAAADDVLVPPPVTDRDSRSGVVGDGGHPADWILLIVDPDSTLEVDTLVVDQGGHG